MFKQKKKGITLIALVVTIIILLILVAVTIALLFGENGIIEKARQSKIASRVATIRDRIVVWQADNEVKRKVGKPEETASEFIERLKTEGILEDTDIVDNKIVIGGETIDIENDPYPHIQVGDIVYYDPTIGVSNYSLLTYTSPKGSSLVDGDGSNVSGNGQQDQTFKVTSSDCKWVVLYKKDGQLILMSEDLKNPSVNPYNGKFGMQGATAYLYAEQELHNICSIYGHANGAVDNAKYLTQPKIGSPDIAGDLQNVIITNPSGARSLMMEDIEYIAEIKNDDDRRNRMEYYAQETGQQDWYTNTFLPNFMTKNIPNYNIKMPTLTQGIVDNKPLNTNYVIWHTDSNIPESLRTHIFKPDWYWMAGRCVGSAPDGSAFCVRHVVSGSVTGRGLCGGNLGSFNRYVSGRSVRPVVCLQSGVKLTEYTENGYNWKVDQN